MYRYILFLLPLLAACKNQPETETVPATTASNEIVLTAAQLSNAGLSTDTLQQRHLTATLRVNGRIEVPPQNLVTISVPYGGYLKSTPLLPGMRVQKGEVLAVLEDPQYITMQQEYLTAQAQLEYLREEYLRQESLNQSKAASDKVFQQANADYAGQKIQVKALSEKLKLLGIAPESLNENTISRTISLRSPIRGYVSTVPVNVGKYVQPSDVLFELIDPSDIHLVLKVFEKDIDDLFIGQKVTAYSNHQPDKKYPGEIILVGKDLAADNSVEVQCHFKSLDPGLTPGMYMNAEIQTQSHRAIVLPAEAILDFEGRHYVFRQLDSLHYRMTEVLPGGSQGGFTEVQFAGETPPADARFATRGAYTLLMMLKNKAEE